MDYDWVDTSEDEDSRWRFGLELRTAKKDIQSLLEKHVMDTTFEGTVDEQKLEYSLRLMSEDLEWKIQDSALVYTVPMDVKLKRKLLWSETRAEGLIDVTLKSSLTLDGKWEVRSQTEWLDHHWRRKPKLKVLGVGITAERLLDFILARSQKDLTRVLDNALRDNLKVSEFVDGLQDLVRSSVRLDHDGGSRYPLLSRLEWSGVRQDGDEFGFQFSALGAFADSAEVYAQDTTTLPDANVRSWQGQQKEAFLQVALWEKELEQYLKYYMGRDSIELSPKREVIIELLSLRIEDGRVHLQLDVEGSAQGVMGISARPVVKSEKNEVVLTDVKLDPSLTNPIYNLGVRLMRSRIKDRIATQLHKSIEGMIQAYHKETNEFVQRSERDYGVTCDPRDLEIGIREIYIHQKHLFVTLTNRGPIYLSVP